ncbi:zinc finger protein GAI-ASSOCIATED FACTOR 1-like [Salvia miltiorrhiza]|uniref:zinc finger protein GAI-ASSOCIATED FACTOR 1-like n=1 Tax=Salvia miltiorrhiza TaxID=226208 RepID=UPI0025AD94DD|nr:zinc finger protein GAI-ASSOCIATED FACTOR 1-like [Salvia miltiorrhiza]
MNDSTASGDDSSGNQAATPKAIPKKKRNLPGMPDPDAEVIALSPKTLMATNRFVCEICKKGFQRDQNLQLHRRGHNLPWKLRQRSSKDVKKRVYVCPEPSCVHHEPSRALGDLTGIKKHFCRKHGEKKWKCDKCSKKYAVQSDWKAHSKICGTKEYKCDCGTLFNRKDSFITHRAFCDALAEETSKPQPATAPPSADDGPRIAAVVSPPSPPTSASSPLPLAPLPSEAPTPEDSSATDVVSLVLPDNNPVTEMLESTKPDSTSAQMLEEAPVMTNLTASCSSSSGSSSNGSSSSNVFASLFASSTSSGSFQSQTAGFSNLFRSIACPDPTPAIAPSASSEPIALCLAVNQGSSIFGTAGQERRQYPPAPQPVLSATALLQKAAQMGAAASNASLLRGLGIVSSSSSPSVSREWSQQHIESDGSSLAAGLGLGLACDSGSGLKELMLGTPSIFGPKHTTLDLLGLGMAASGGSTGGLSVLMNGGLDVAAATPFDGREFGGQDIR